MSKLVKKQIVNSSIKIPGSVVGLKKTNRLFNVSNQSSSAFLKASDVLLNPFSLNER